MSTPSDHEPATPPRSPRPPSAASRYLFLFLLGLVVGIVAVVMVLRAIDARKTWQDHYPHAAMQLMQAHTAQLAATTRANRCAATDTLPHLRALRELGNDLEPAFADLRDDERFAGHAGTLRQRLDGALSSPPLDCAGATRVLEQIGEACKACHQEFRG
jgi:hypothetical protein